MVTLLECLKLKNKLMGRFKRWTMGKAIIHLIRSSTTLTQVAMQNL